MRFSIFGGLFIIFGLVYENHCQITSDAISSPCPVPGKGQFIPDSESREIYWMCLPNGPILMRCPSQLTLNITTGICEQDSSSKIIQQQATSILTTPRLASKDVYATINVGYMTAAPDGVIVDHVLTSNQNFPGITIEAKRGDTLHVTVRDSITDEHGEHPLTTIHWHGLYLANGLAIYDGPEGVTQCGISYNKVMKYDIPLVQSGTFWWHSHAGTQYTEGLLGALIIKDDNDPYLDQYDYDNLVFTLGDWYHTPANPNLEKYKLPAPLSVFPRPDSALINGHGTFPCSETTRPCILQQPKVYEVIPGARYRIRVINVSTFWMFKFYIEGHTLEIIEVDGILTKKTPPCDYIIMSSGQRYSIIVTMNSESSSFNRDFRIHAINNNNVATNGSRTSAILRYKDAYRNPRGFTKKDEELMSYEKVELDERLLVPYDDNDVPPSHCHEKVYLEVKTKNVNGTNYLTFNDIIFETEGAPILYRMLNNMPIPQRVNPLNISYGKVVEVELYNGNGAPHPFHLHGHSFWVVASGPPNSGRMRFPYPKPIRRDTVTVQANATIVFKFVADNPGAWLFHCHINWHHLVGLAAVFIEGQDQVGAKVQYPEWARQLCLQSGNI